MLPQLENPAHAYRAASLGPGPMIAQKLVFAVADQAGMSGGCRYPSRLCPVVVTVARLQARANLLGCCNNLPAEGVDRLERSAGMIRVGDFSMAHGGP